MDEWVGIWMGRWIDGWVGEWMSGLVVTIYLSQKVSWIANKSHPYVGVVGESTKSWILVALSKHEGLK